MEKVLHILPMNKVSGAEKMALIMCKNLKDYSPVVVCGGEELKNVFSNNGIKSYSLNFSTSKLLSAAKGIKEIVKKEDIKIIHAHDNTASLCGYLAKKIFKLDAKIISHIHNCYPWLKENGFNKRIDSVIRPKYDYNIACGKTVYDFYKKNTNYLKEEKSSILSNAMDIDEITKRNFNNKDNIKSIYNIPKNKTVFGFIGRISEQKGIKPFIIELSKHKNNFSDSIFLLVGSGEQDDEVKSLIKELRMEDMFILTGHEEDVYKFYPIIDIFFLPSIYEGLPMVILEAMAFKKPIVTMNVGSISEVINKETGMLVEVGRYKEFICDLRTLKNNKKLRVKYSNNAFRSVSKNYNIENYVEEVTKIYNKLA